MAVSTTECLNKVRKMAMALINGQIKALTKAIGATTTSMDTVNTPGQTAESTLGSGKPTNSMAKASTSGLMVANTMENTKWTRNMGMAPTIGLTAKPTRDTGFTASNMGRLSLPILKAEARWAFGRMEKERNG